MVTSIAAPVAAQFSISQAFADSFQVLRRNFLTFVILSFLFRLIALLAPLFDHAGRIAGELTWTDQVARPVAEVIAGGLAEAAVAFGTVLTLQGRPASLADVGRGLRFSLPVTIASLIYCAPSMAVSVGLSLGEQYLLGAQASAGMYFVLALVALVFAIAIPIIMLAWFIYGPAIVFEQTGAIRGLTRSAELTKGYRWRLVGICLLLMLMYFAVVVPISFIADVKVADLLSPTRPSISAAIAYLGVAVFRAFGAVMIVVVYCSLCAEKERITADSIAP
jgi:hypothetical protein